MYVERAVEAVGGSEGWRGEGVRELRRWIGGKEGVRGHWSWKRGLDGEEVKEKGEREKGSCGCGDSNVKDEL